jgi:ankyrin repeat protein
MSNRNSEEITALRPRLFKAAKSGNVQVLHQILDPGQVSGENDLRIALQKASEAGNEEAVEVLLGKGAKTDVITNKGLSPLHRAVERGHTGIITLLLSHGASSEVRDQSGRTVYICATSRGQNSILEFLQQKCRVDTNAVDHDGRTALHTLAADTHHPCKWNGETVRILLAAGIHIDKVDKLGRTALHWAAATGKISVASKIFEVSAGRTVARVRVTTERGRTALHLAAENNHAEMVRLLLRNGALKEATSDGNWTALLNAAKNGHEEAVDALLSSDANVNARTSSGMTALHWAAELGHLGVVKRILKEDQAWKNSKDSFDSTPLARAGQHGYQAIVQALRPHIFEGSLSPDAREACERFKAAVVDFYYDDKTLKRSLVKKKTVYETIYAIDPKDPSKEKFAITTSIEDITSNPPDFRWIHLPSNNVAWAEALITKFFLEKGLKGATDAAGYKAMLRIFGEQQHRGPKVHSRFMRPFCQRISDGQSQTGPARRPKSRNQSPAKADEPRVPEFATGFKRPIHKDIIVLFVSLLSLTNECELNDLFCEDAIPALGHRL